MDPSSPVRAPIPERTVEAARVAQLTFHGFTPQSSMGDDYLEETIAALEAAMDPARGDDALVVKGPHRAEVIAEVRAWLDSLGGWAWRVERLHAEFAREFGEAPGA